MKYYLKRNSHRILKAFFGLVFVSALLFGLWLFLDTRGTVVNLTEKDQNSDSAAVITLESRVLNFGSISWGGNLGASDAPFEDLIAFGRTDYDVWIANLACHIEASENCDLKLYKDFAKWYSVVGVGSVGGDATRDEATTRALIDNNIQFFGDISATDESSKCDVVSLPARFRLENGSFRQASMPIVLCGLDGSKSLSIDLSEAISTASKSLPVWVFALDDIGATPIEITTHYHSYIDAGADLVIGVAKPSLGEVERYKDGVIVYSLGNFMGPKSTATPEGLSALLGVTIVSDRTDDLIEWTEIAKTCSGYNDLCLEAGMSKSLSRPSYEYTFSLKGVSTADSYSPAPANALQISDIAGYMKWVRIGGDESDDQEETVF